MGEVKTKKIGEQPFEVYVQGKVYRVTNITHFCGMSQESDEVLTISLENLPPSEGLNIEQKSSDSSYAVIATVKYDDDGEPKFEDIGFRSIESLVGASWEEIQEYLNCVEFAKQFLLDIDEKENTMGVC